MALDTEKKKMWAMALHGLVFSMRWRLILRRSEKHTQTGELVLNRFRNQKKNERTNERNEREKKRNVQDFNYQKDRQNGTTIV